MAIVGVGDVSAHRRDEYLQAARLGIDPGRVQIELDLTPGIAVAEAILADIDRNRDGSLSADEQRAYVSLVLSAVTLEVDGTRFRVQLGDLQFSRRPTPSGEVRAPSGFNRPRHSPAYPWAPINCCSATATIRIAASISRTRWCQTATTLRSPRSGATSIRLS